MGSLRNLKLVYGLPYILYIISPPTSHRFRWSSKFIAVFRHVSICFLVGINIYSIAVAKENVLGDCWSSGFWMEWVELFCHCLSGMYILVAVVEIFLYFLKTIYSKQ